MARRKYGSKAAYEAARGTIRDGYREQERRWNMSDKEREAEDLVHLKARNKDRLSGDDAMMTWCMFAGAALAGGKGAPEAGKAADQMIQIALSKFT